jgi:hypothetical protein
MKACAEITPDTVRKLLRTILTELNDYPERLRDEIHQLIDRIEVSPEALEAILKSSRQPASCKAGELLASPRGFEPRYLP